MLFLDGGVGENADERKDHAVSGGDQCCQNCGLYQRRESLFREEQGIRHMKRLNQKQGHAAACQYQQSGNRRSPAVAGKHPALAPVLFHCKDQPQDKAANGQNAKGDDAGHSAQHPCGELLETAADGAVQGIVPGVYIIAHSPFQRLAVCLSKNNAGLFPHGAAQVVLHQIGDILHARFRQFGTVAGQIIAEVIQIVAEKGVELRLLYQHIGVFFRQIRRIPEVPVIETLSQLFGFAVVFQLYLRQVHLGNGAGKGVLGQKAVQDAAAKQGNAEKQCQQKQQDRAEHCAGTGRLFRRFRLFFRSSVCCRFGFLFCHMDSSYCSGSVLFL